ncbi:MAG: hypothetical protein RL757_1459 [Bacteroidota bacterium]|jgi:hypothetical protein
MLFFKSDAKIHSVSRIKQVFSKLFFIFFYFLFKIIKIVFFDPNFYVLTYFCGLILNFKKMK